MRPAPAAALLALWAAPALAQEAVPPPPALPLPVSATAQFELPVSTLTPHADFSADRLDYDDVAKTAALTGHAKVTDSTWTMTSDAMTFDMERELFVSTAPLELTDRRTTFDAQSGSFDFAAREGDFQDVIISAPPLSFQGRELEFEEGRYTLYGAVSTSCDYKPPHYHVTSSKLEIFPSHWVVGYGSVFYLGRYPILYFPIFWRSLAPDPPYITHVMVGDDARNGVEFLTDTTFKLAPNVSNGVYLDGYSSQGVGLGDELGYKGSGGSRGNFYGYGINDAQGHRWTFLGDDFQRLAPGITMQARLQEMSDPEFNNVYMRSNDLRVAQYLLNSVAFTRQDHYTTLRLSADNEEIQDPNNPDQFLQQSADMPRLDFNTAPFKILGLPILNTVTAFGDRSTNDEEGFWQDSGGASWTMNQKIRLARNLSFVPSAGVSETYYDKEDQFEADGSSTVLTNQLNARYFTTPTLQYGWYYGQTTLGYDYTARLASDSMDLDSSAPDHGIEENMATIEHIYRPSFTTRYTISSGYNLAEAPATSTGPYSINDRIQPIVFDAQFNPKPKIFYELREVYGVLGGQQSLLLNASYGAVGSDHVGVNLVQSQSDQGTTYFGPAFGWHPKTSTWAIEADIRTAVRSGGSYLDDPHIRAFEAFDDTVIITKTWHDFIGKFTFRERPGGVLEYTAGFNMRLGRLPEDAKRETGFEEEMFPWRTGGEDR